MIIKFSSASSLYWILLIGRDDFAHGFSTIGRTGIQLCRPTNLIWNAISTTASATSTTNKEAQEQTNGSDGAVIRAVAASTNDNTIVKEEFVDRPLLRKFGRRIKKRVHDSEDGMHHFGEVGAYTSDETIPCLDMQVTRNQDACEDGERGGGSATAMSSRGEIREAFTESSRINNYEGRENTHKSQQQNRHAFQQSPHGRSSGSGCTIIRLTGSDAISIHGLIDYADRFFELVDNDENNSVKGEEERIEIDKLGDAVKNAGVFRIANHVYAGFDEDINGEGRMQFLDTRIVSQEVDKNNKSNCKNNSPPIILPMEVGDLVGSQSINDAHKGMDTLMNIGSQITSAVLGMDAASVEKLIDDGTVIPTTCPNNDHQQKQQSQVEEPKLGDNVSNSYHRLVRYLKPEQPPSSSQNNDNNDAAAFQPHVDSSFLTLIPMPELPGLEVWCPQKEYTNDRNDGSSSSKRGEWVRPIVPFSDIYGGEDVASGNNNTEHRNDCCDEKCAYIIAMAGEFLQLVSDGEVPVCIHRVIPPPLPPPPPSIPSSSSSSNTECDDTSAPYKLRISAPLFLRTRRGKDALLDVENDLRCTVEHHPSSTKLSSQSPRYEEKGLYYEKGLLEECDSMHLWSAHELMSRK